MGWTHHWRRGTELPAEQFAQAAADCENLMRAVDLPLANGEGAGAPVFSPDEIVFAAPGGAGCEPFVCRRVQHDRCGRPVVRSFCKTEHAPYDLCVQGALIVLKHHLGRAITVGSDGDDDWREAVGVCHRHLGYGQDFKLENDRGGAM